MAMAEFLLNVPAVEITDELTSEEEDVSLLPHVDSSVLLADAIKKMDGLIGDFKPEAPCAAMNDPIVMAIMDYCDKLYHLMRQWDVKHSDEEVKGESHASTCISSEVKQLIVSWLANRRMESPVEVEQLRRDKDELLNQVVSLQQQLEVASNENEKLGKKVEDLERSCVEKDQHNRSLSDELKSTKASLHSKEVEVRHLKDQIQAGYRSNSPLTSSSVKPADRGTKRVTLLEPNGALEVKIDRGVRKGSFKRSIFKALSRKKTPTTSADEPAPSSPTQPRNPRAAAFCAKDGKQLSDWFTSIGLDMYSDLVEKNLTSGEQLVTMVTSQNNTLLAQIGIVSTLHCKKVRLAVEDAINEVASPLSEMDHEWVGEWLKDIGLPQYQRKFLDARIDCRMLDVITMENLSLLDIDAPFHIVSFKRAIQAFRMCGYNRDYLKESPSEAGSQKLLHWSAKDVADWVKTIELDEYVGGLQEAGVNGAVMLLDVHFTSESLAGALGISNSMGLIRTHLSRKFMELIGPIAAQKKYDAMQSKNFVALDPSDTGRAGHRMRSRSMGSRRGRHQDVQEVLLCPLGEFPARGIIHEATPPPGDPSTE